MQLLKTSNVFISFFFFRSVFVRLFAHQFHFSSVCFFSSSCCFSLSLLSFSGCRSWFALKRIVCVFTSQNIQKSRCFMNISTTRGKKCISHARYSWFRCSSVHFSFLLFILAHHSYSVCVCAFLSFIVRNNPKRKISGEMKKHFAKRKS